MPTTKPTTGMEILGRKQSISEEEWVALIEARRDLIKPHLDKFTLTELRNIQCLRSEVSFSHAVRNDSPKVSGDEEFSLNTQGIFDNPRSAEIRIPNSGFRPGPHGLATPNGKLQIWGLARSGQWVLVTVNFVGEAGYKDRGYERATEVLIVSTTIETIINQTKENPLEIWKTLGQAIKNFAEHRLALYEATEALAQKIEIEETMMSLIPKGGETNG